MAGKDRSSSTMGAMAHRHYRKSHTGDAATTEFDIGGTVDRVEDVMVYVAGLLQRPKDAGTANDYSVRGLSAGYDGDKNRIKFLVAPGAAARIDILRVGG